MHAFDVSVCINQLNSLPIIQCLIFHILMLILHHGERGFDLISFLVPNNPMQDFQIKEYDDITSFFKKIYLQNLESHYD